MHDDMAGFYEARVDGPGRRHYRLFCILERDGAQLGLSGPSIVLVTGMDKPFRTEFPKTDYAAVRALATSTARGTLARWRSSPSFP